MNDVDKLVRVCRIPTNGVHLNVAEAGPADGPLLFLLHGFPEFWYGWRAQIGPLANAGFRVVAPDQRGYNLSDKPLGVEKYDLDLLARDVIGLADHFRSSTFAVVGHDWEALTAWWLAVHHSSRLRGIVVMSAPFPAVWVDAMESNADQKRRSRYVRLLGLPKIPEFLISLNRRGMLSKTFQDCTVPEAFGPEDLARYETALSQPGALTAAINYYRAVLRRRFKPAVDYRIEVPTLILWGDRDRYAVPELADASGRLCRNARLVHVPEATHWLHHEQPAMVSEQITGFFQ